MIPVLLELTEVDDDLSSEIIPYALEMVEHSTNAFTVMFMSGPMTGSDQQGTGSELQTDTLTVPEPLRFEERILQLDIRAIIAYIHAMPLNDDRAKLLDVLPFILSQFFKIRDSVSRLSEEIEARREAFQLYTTSHPCYPGIAGDLAAGYGSRFGLEGAAGDVGDLDEAILLYRRALPLVDYDDPNTLVLLHGLAKVCKWRYERCHQTEDLDSAIAYFKHALRIPPSRRISHATVFYDLAVAVDLRFQETDDITCLHQMIHCHQQAIALLPPNHRDLFNCHVRLFRAHNKRYQLLGDEEDMESSIKHQHQALDLAPDPDPSRTPLLREIGDINVKYHQGGRTSPHILNEAIVHLSEALTRVTSEDAGSGSFDYYVALIRAIHARYEQSQDVNDMNESVRLQEEALSHWPVDKARPISTIMEFGDMCIRYARGHGEGLHLDLAIRRYGEMIASVPAAQHAVVENNQPFKHLDLALFYDRRFEQLGSIDDFNLATSHKQQALDTCPKDDPSYADCLKLMAGSLVSRYERVGDIQDLQDAITHLRSAVKVPPSDPDPLLQCLGAVNNLASALRRRYLRLGDVDDIEESIKYSTEAVEIAREHKMPELPKCLNGLATGYCMRFDQMGDLSCLDRGIDLYREALDTFPPGHPGSTSPQINLVGELKQRYGLLGNQSDLVDALDYLKRVSPMVKPGHKDFLLVLSGTSSLLKFLASAEVVQLDVLDSMINDLQQALELCPHPHPQRIVVISNTADAFEARARHRDSPVDLDMAISLYRQCLEEIDDRHTLHASVSTSLAHTLRVRFFKCRNPPDLDEAISIYRQAEANFPSEHPGAGSISSSLGDTLLCRSAIHGNSEDFDEGLTCYQRTASNATVLSSLRFSIAHRWASFARRYDHSSTLQAYSTCLSLLDRFVTTSHTIGTQHKRLATIPQSTPLSAASFAITKDHLELAVELLEQGRAILWAQVGRYRTPLDRLKEEHPSLAVEFRRLSIQLEKDVVAVGMEIGDAARYRALSVRLEEIVERIRSMKGFSDFLKATPFAKLRKAATNGPVIVINIDEYRSDALIIQHNTPPILVPLNQATPDAITSLATKLNTALRHHGADKVKTLEVTTILRSLWDLIVHPIVQRLQGDCGIPNGSRIWWCPTSALWSLPLHAAGPYRKGERNLPDIFTSSYTPTLSALLRAMHKHTNGSDGLPQTLLVVGQSQALGQAPLSSVSEEIKQAHELVPSVRVLNGQDATNDAVIRDLQDCSWAHFACHGHQDLERPFNAHFSLHDGPLTILDLIQSDLPRAEFAFLSACHSAAGDRKNPNEAIHLAAGLQFSGFGGVVGTMWAMADVDGPVITKEFYKYMFRDGRMVADFRDAAEGLNAATKVLRRMKVPVERWINFIHIGA